MKEYEVTVKTLNLIEDKIHTEANSAREAKLKAISEQDYSDYFLGQIFSVRVHEVVYH